MLTDRVKRLQNLNISCFAIACNTAHMMFDTLASASSIPFVSMIDAVANEVKKGNIENVGILATPSTIKSGLYQISLQKFGIKVILPSGEQIVQMENVIRKIIAGTNTNSDSETLAQIADSLKKKGARAIILGCTELPLAFPKDFSLPVFDSIEVLSRALLSRFFGRRTDES